MAVPTLLWPGTSADGVIEVTAAAEDGVLVVGEQVLVVHSGSGVRHLRGLRPGWSAAGHDAVATAVTDTGYFAVLHPTSG